jgi:hypothetical protein
MPGASLSIPSPREAIQDIPLRPTFCSKILRHLGLLPDHDTLATFRRTFLPELKELFVQVLLFAQETGVLTLGMISLDGTKIHADASRHKAVSSKRLRGLETQLRTEVEELFVLSEQLDQER